MMRGSDTDQLGRQPFLKMGRHKPYINLLLKTKEGESYLVDTLPARRGARLKKVGQALAAACEGSLPE